MKMSFLVRRRISSLSIPPLLSDDYSDRDIVSAVLDTVLPDSGGTRNRLKFDGVLRFFQNSTPEHMEVAPPAWRWRGGLYHNKFVVKMGLCFGRILLFEEIPGGRGRLGEDFAEVFR